MRDAGHLDPGDRRARKLREVKAYLYTGWSYTGWGTAPVGSQWRDLGYTGFYFDRVDDSSGSGFGAEVLLDRLASGLHFGTRCDGADMFQVNDQEPLPSATEIAERYRDAKQAHPWETIA
jgi:hypothetical protein